MSFPAYPDYQDSGVEWLGDVPSHWTVERLTHLYREAIEPGEEHLPILSVSIHSGVSDEEASPDEGDRKITRSDDRTKYKKVLPGDLVYNMMRAWQGGFGAVQVPGMVSPAYVVARPRGDVSSRYIELLLRTPGAVEEMRRLSRGITDFRLRLYWDEFKSIRVAMPPAIDREAILAFLDGEIGKIDGLIEEQRRLIALLKEKRQAVISHAVTKGLAPHASMKDSCIEWLGGVPAHWDVRRIKHVARMESGHTPDRKVQAYWEDCDIPWVSLHDTGYLKDHDYISETAQMVNALGIANSSARILPLGVVVFSRDATIGRCAITTRPMAVSQHFIAWVCGPALNAEFLLFCLRSMTEELERLTAGATLKTIGMPDVRTLTIAIPPLSEQHAIVAHAKSEAEGIDTLIEHVTEAHRLLQERRSALISAAVTGKIDVRGSSKVLTFPVDRARARGLVGTEIIERSAGQPTFGRVKFQKVVFLAEGHVGISELAGCYTRAAAGPLDGALIDEMEHTANSIAGIERDQPGGSGTTNSYRLTQPHGAHRRELADWLGPDRTAKLDKLIDDFAGLTTKQAEAVATLYGVWNDALIEGASPTDDEIITGFLNDWHPEKREKFRASELPEWLGWMRRHGIVPTGSGPTTTTGRLFV